MNEKQLVEKVRKGNKRAFRKLYEQNVTQLYRFLAQFSKEHDEIDDWVQHSFIKAYENIDRFEGKSRFSTWLIRIAINHMRSEFRKAEVRKSISIDENEVLQLAGESIDIEWRQDLKEVVDSLDALKKSVFILYEVEGYSHKEISEMLDISASVSRVSLCRAKKILQESIVTAGGIYD